MYPHHHSSKTVLVMLVLGILGGLIFSFASTNTRSAQAYFPPGESGDQSQSNQVDDGVHAAVGDISIQEGEADGGSFIAYQEMNSATLPQSFSPASMPIPPQNSGSMTAGDPVVISAYVSARSDDAEERTKDGRMYLTSNDMELVYDPGVAKDDQKIGVRFTGINIPRDATIVEAYLEFAVAEASGENTSLVLYGQAADNASTFSKGAYNVSGRSKTAASVSWNNVPTWNTVGVKVQSPDLTGVIQEVVSRSGWVEGNSLAIIMEGTGRRIAAAYESSSLSPALLHVVYLPFIATATPPPPNPDPMPVGQTGEWNMVFDDEFNGSSLDTSKWRTCFWWADETCTIESNNEMQLYNPEDVMVGNGVLRLRAQKRDMVAWNGVTYHYTSGMVMTGGRGGSNPIPPGFSFLYGFAEALVRVPAGQGLWPAFWTLSADYSWPPEIDIMEILGDEPSIYHMHYHFVGGDDGSTWTGPDFSAGWHVLGVDWSPDAIVWYVDGAEHWRYDIPANITNEVSYLLLDLAVGGNWPGPPDNNTPFPSYYDIDYVRVWQRP